MVRQFQQPPSGGAPTSPPPSFVPQQPQAQQQQSYGHFFPGPGPSPWHPQNWSMCFFRNTYVWLYNGRSFWMFPIFADRHFVYGYRWNGFRWEYRPIERRRVLTFTCRFY